MKVFVAAGSVSPGTVNLGHGKCYLESTQKLRD
jgi:hypothetical protein